MDVAFAVPYTMLQQHRPIHDHQRGNITSVQAVHSFQIFLKNISSAEQSRTGHHVDNKKTASITFWRSIGNIFFFTNIRGWPESAPQYFCFKLLIVATTFIPSSLFPNPTYKVSSPSVLLFSPISCLRYTPQGDVRRISPS